jgi:hypothetical protein
MPIPLMPDMFLTFPQWGYRDSTEVKRPNTTGTSIGHGRKKYDQIDKKPVFKKWQKNVNYDHLSKYTIS